MAEKKKKGSAFEYPTIGSKVPDGYVMVRKANGRIEFVPPKKAKAKKKK